MQCRNDNFYFRNSLFNILFSNIRLRSICMSTICLMSNLVSAVIKIDNDFLWFVIFSKSIL